MKEKNLLLLGALLTLSTFAYAGLTITPARHEFVVQPGKTYQGEFTVRNDYSTKTPIEVEKKDWFVLPENKDIGIADWLTVTEKRFSLRPGESRKVRFQIKVPRSAVGSLVGMVSFVALNEEEQGITLAISNSVFVNVAGTEKIDWRVGETRVSSSGGRIQVLSEVRNSGNVYVRPQGVVRIASSGREVAVLPFKESGPVYPGMTRTFIAVDDAGTLKAGRYNALVQVTCNGLEKSTTIAFTIDDSGAVAVN